MAGWRDNLRPASFRGVAFEVMESSRDLGRKVAVHDFPLRDFATGEDLGKSPGTISLNALIIGTDYMTARDAFEAALNMAGTGVLIVPWTGQRTVRLTSAKATETSKEGGMVSYALEFMIEETAPPPQVSVDTGAQVTSAADSLETAATDTFTEAFSTTGQPNFVSEAATDLLSQLSNTFDTLTAPLKATGDLFDSYVAQGLALRNQAVALVLKPADLISQVSGIIQGIRTIAATPSDALNGLKTLMDFGSGLKAVSTATPARIQQAANQAAIVSVVRQLAAAEAIQAVSEIDFAAYDDAIDTRDEMADILDDLSIDAGDAGDDDLWASLKDARLAMIADVTARGGSLARLYSFTPVMTTSALVLAYQLYDDVSDLESNAEDIIARNRIEHPGFVRGGVALEVLSNG